VVSGVTVSLLDSSGNPIPVNGQPVTTVSDTNGNYSFGYVAPGIYHVSFPSEGSDNVTSADAISGATGTVTGSSPASNSVAQSGDVAIAIGTDAVVNGVYAEPVVVTTTTTTTTTTPSSTTTTQPGLAYTGSNMPKQVYSVFLMFALGGLFLALVRRRVLKGH
jgi:hypothetical protein